MGTPEGGERAAASNKARYGADFYSRIGKIGGAKGHTGGFAYGEIGRERARLAGSVGGKISKRPKGVR